jgi:hypothetical protein
MKERLKAKAPRTLEALEAELKPALDTITAKDAEAGSGMPAMLYTEIKSALIARNALHGTTLVAGSDRAYNEGSPTWVIQASVTERCERSRLLAEER